MADRHQAQRIQRLPGLGQLFEGHLQGFAVVGDRPVTDPLDGALGDLGSRIRFDDIVFQ